MWAKAAVTKPFMNLPPVSSEAPPPAAPANTERANLPASPGIPASGPPLASMPAACPTAPTTNPSMNEWPGAQVRELNRHDELQLAQCSSQVQETDKRQRAAQSAPIERLL